jgi:pyruvate dehydrogenase (quinone)
VLIEAVVDPEIPPLPPHITLEQAKLMLSAIRHGDPNARQLIGHSIRQKLAEFLR